MTRTPRPRLCWPGWVIRPGGSRETDHAPGAGRAAGGSSAEWPGAGGLGPVGRAHSGVRGDRHPGARAVGARVAAAGIVGREQGVRRLAMADGPAAHRPRRRRAGRRRRGQGGGRAGRRGVGDPAGQCAGPRDSGAGSRCSRSALGARRWRRVGGVRRSRTPRGTRGRGRAGRASRGVRVRVRVADGLALRSALVRQPGLDAAGAAAYACGGNRRAGNRRAWNRQTGNRRAGNRRAANRRAGNRRAGERRRGAGDLAWPAREPRPGAGLADAGPDDRARVRLPAGARRHPAARPGLAASRAAQRCHPRRAPHDPHPAGPAAAHAGPGSPRDLEATFRPCEAIVDENGWQDSP